MTLRAIIFDVDGTLAETEELHRRAFNETFAAHGLDWHWDQDRYRELLQVTGGKERMAHDLAERGLAADDHDIPTLHRAKTGRYTQLMARGEIALRPGIADLIRSGRETGLRLAIATTTSRPNIDALIRATLGCEAGELFDAIAAGDEVAEKKPAPDVYLLALDRLGVPPEHAVALEDSANGLMSARAAGLRCVVSPATYTAGDPFPDDCTIVGDFTHVASTEALERLLEAKA
ncbi:HAD family hydrolase [Paracoccus chinensis]|uniref:Haloacid dehalogenase superfamily, subfamily IA, variant 3 with third motif having DD or ED n=1 Tax=Paracoccus chinensis TaxID=525640 RepID=A0A1G9N518_9RHOB|nr:haloacid dehalogenase superfamily, subfamily IA, variant 3 with third motif having DD or ED [Paracoccus chinensis]